MPCRKALKERKRISSLPKFSTAPSPRPLAPTHRPPTALPAALPAAGTVASQKIPLTLVSRWGDFFVECSLFLSQKAESEAKYRIGS